MAVTFIFGVHNHQPIGNFDEVIDKAVRLAYRPFLHTLRHFPRVRALVHTSGPLLDWFEAHAPDMLDLLAELAGRGQVEPLTGGLTEPILPLLPDHDKMGQIRALSERVSKRLGVWPRGMWLAERVWEPHLARPIVEASVEYIFVDDHHFAAAGLDPETLSGYYLTEEQGRTLAVFPISQRLRYLIPFRPVEEAFTVLREAAVRGGALTMVDDGEKFGIWPGTHRLAYDEGWLEAFFSGLGRLPGVEIGTAGDYLDRNPPTGRVYLPTTSYAEMGEWALDPGAADDLRRARAALEAASGPGAGRLLRGGFWRHFLVRYPEVNDTYRKMLRLSERVAAGLAARPGDRRLLAAREAVWRGQCNDAYWHGIFGGVYLPHLRRAIRSALLAAEDALDRAEVPGACVAAETGDLDGDGVAEVLIRSSRLTLVVRPAEGGTVTELAYRPVGFDLADVLTRRRESSHQRIAEVERASADGGVMGSIHDTWTVKESGLDRLLDYDPHRRASLQDYVLEPQSGGGTWVAFPGLRCEARVREEADHVAVELRARALAQETPVELEKVIEVRADTDGIGARYAVRAAHSLEARFAVRWNLALTGPAPDRYYRTEKGDTAPLASIGEREGERLDLVDEWLGLVARLSWSPHGRVDWEPVYTVSLSEAGLERIWQGAQVTVSWPVTLGPEPWTCDVGLALETPAGGAR
ncbi:MAG: alpha-amylase/4-alpha-glucanotransferase domain-containing protein [Candidatus Rokuibacteriota bacterium]